MSNQRRVVGFHQNVIDELRANAGRVRGPSADIPLLTTTGTGRQSTVPRAYLQDNGHLVVAAGGGSPHHPDWYRNLVFDPAVLVEVGGERFPAPAEVVPGDVRDMLYRRFAPQNYRVDLQQSRTGRCFPLLCSSPASATTTRGPSVKQA